MKNISVSRTSWVVSNILIGVAIGVLISLALAMIAVAFINNKMINESRIDMIIAPIHLAATFVGCIISGKRMGRQYAIICGIVAILYCIILLSSTILFFDGVFQKVGLGVVMCAAGSIGACAICMMGKGRRRK